MSLGGVVNKLTVTDVHSGVRDGFRRGAKEEQIARLESFAVYGNHARPRGLLVGIARHIDAARPHQHLRETGAIVAKARTPTP